MSGGFGERSSVSHRMRLVSLAILVVVSLGLYGVHLFDLQVVRGNEFQRRAREVAQRSAIIRAQRGEIYDRNFDVPLAINIPSFAVNIIPGELSAAERQKLLPRLARILETGEEQILQRLPDEYDHLFQPVEITGGVSLRKISYIAEHIEDFPGVSWNSKSIRSYTIPGSLSHLIGYVGDITREELQVLYNQGYSTASSLGKSGIEKLYDSLLRGTDGTRFSTVDVRGRRISQPEVEEQPPVSGRNLVLTIDRRIQRLCEQALGERVGSVVVLKPASGEVLAMVSYPWFNPNIFGTERDLQEYRRLTLDPQFPFLNRAVQSSYAPASTFKTIMTAAILEEKVFPPDQRIDCDGSIWVGDRIFNCHKKTGHGPLDLRYGLAESCDVYFWTVGLKHLGIDRIVDFSASLDSARQPGSIFPAKLPGSFRHPSGKRRSTTSSGSGEIR